MRPISVTVGSATFSDWIPLDRLAQSLWVALGVKLTSGASLTYSVQQTLDNLHDSTEVFSITRSTTTATVKLTDHRLSVADWVGVEACGAPFDGGFAVASIVDADTFTYTVANSGASANGPGRIRTARVVEHATLTALTASAEGNYAYCPWACRLNVSSYTSGKATLNVLQGFGI